MKKITIYTAASFKQLHAVKMFHSMLKKAIPNIEILDWTKKSRPPIDMEPEEKRKWFDTEQKGGQVFSFCADACMNADILVYFGQSGQDAGIEAGIAYACGKPIIGVLGPLEAPGLMLNGIVRKWVHESQQAVDLIEMVAKCRKKQCLLMKCSAFPICLKNIVKK